MYYIPGIMVPRGVSGGEGTWLIWNQTDVSLVPNQLENGKYNLISVSFHEISRKFLCMCGVSPEEVTDLEIDVFFIFK